MILDDENKLTIRFSLDELKNLIEVYAVTTHEGEETYKLKDDFDKIMMKAQKELDDKQKTEKKSPDEEVRHWVANPTSAEHVK